MKLVATPIVAAALLLSAYSPLNAEIIRHHEGSLSITQSSAVPRNGLHRKDVLAKYGEPVHRHAAVGNPPISSWEYDGFEVYFEYDIVLHTVIKVASR